MLFGQMSVFQMYFGQESLVKCLLAKCLFLQVSSDQAFFVHVSLGQMSVYKCLLAKRLLSKCV